MTLSTRWTERLRDSAPCALLRAILRWFGIGLGVWLIAETGDTAANVCGRTRQVRDAITAASGAPGCGEVSHVQLRDVTALDLSHRGIRELRGADFDGLVRLSSLDLSGNNLTHLPGGVFDDLVLLESLHLGGNELSSLASGLFDQLFLLEELTLGDNRFALLPENYFDEFSRFDGTRPNGDPPDNSGPYPRIQRFLDRHHVSSPEAFIAALPPLYRERFVMVYASEAAAAEHVSADHPRIAAWGADGQFIFAWNTDPDAPTEFRESVEFLRQDDFAWTAGLIDFSGETPEISAPASCRTCHGSLNKPLWGMWGTWEGSEYRPYSADDYAAFAAAMEVHRTSTDPRIEPLDFSASVFATRPSAIRFLMTPGELDYVAAVEEAGAVWSWRHAEVLFRILQSRHRDFVEWGTELVCQNSEVEALFQPTVRSFDQSDHNLFVAANSDLVIEDGLVNASDLVRYNYYYHPDGSVGDALIFLTIVELWRADPLVRHLYRKTSNAETTHGHSRLVEAQLHYPSGSATAEEELIQKLRLHFGQGGRNGLRIRARQHDGLRLGVLSASFWDGHAERMRPRVCRALTRSAPTNLRVAVESGTPVLRWDAPLYDPDSLTGFRIRRGVDGAQPGVLVEDTGSTDTTWSDESPPAGDVVYAAQAIYDGYYLSHDSNEVEVAVLLPLAELNATFEGVPDQHDGFTEFRLRLRFTEPIASSYRALRDESLVATNGHVTRARRVDGRSDLWEIGIQPSANSDIVVTLPRTADCAAGGAVCTADQTPLSDAASATIPFDPQPLTASLRGEPAGHDGETEFTFELHFSEEIPISYRTLRDEAFTVTAGEVRRAKRLSQGSNLGWRIHVEPDSDEEVVLILPADRACNEAGAICAADGRPLSQRLEIRVPGPG